jgi:hypothetical protein
MGPHHIPTYGQDILQIAYGRSGASAALFAGLDQSEFWLSCILPPGGGKNPISLALLDNGSGATEKTRANLGSN